MKKIIMLVFICVAVALALTTLSSEDWLKVLEPNQTDDVLVKIRVGVYKDAAVHPDVPSEIRMLNRCDSMIYDSEVPALITKCIIFMTVPKEYKSEILDRISKVGNVELVTAANEADVESVFGDYATEKARELQAIDDADILTP